MGILPAGWEQLQNNVMRVWVDIPPRRNGEPNAVAAMQALRVASRINPDAYDPQEVPAEQIALADGVTATGAGLLPHNIAFAAIRDGAVPPEDDEGEPYPIPGCASGACQGD